MSKKRSFFERLTGTINIDEDEDLLEVEDSQRRSMQVQSAAAGNTGNSWMEEAAGEGELAIDVYETPDDVIVRTMIPGVKRDEVDVSLSRDSITIRGQRKEDRTIGDQDYHFRELYWGTFSRTISLPHEVDVDRAEATEAQGVLTIKLPRIDKGRKTKLRVKSL